jgi:hypothetical protein
VQLGFSAFKATEYLLSLLLCDGTDQTFPLRVSFDFAAIICLLRVPKAFSKKFSNRSQVQGFIYALALLRDLRGRPGFRFFTALRSFGSMSHSRPTFIAFKRPLSMSARTLFALTPSLWAASVVPMIFMAREYSTGWNYGAVTIVL